MPPSRRTTAETPVVIAIDGPAASGKGTLARRLADHFGYAHLDTGLLYRAVGHKLIEAGEDPTDAAKAAEVATEIEPGDLEAPALRSEPVAEAAGIVAAHPGVRTALLDFQRRFAAEPPNGAPGAVLDGRDIGTVVCPDARFKIFLEASLEVRAERRVRELQDKGVRSIPSRVLRDMEVRDARDRARSVAPLVPAGDALVIDTSAMDADGAFNTVLTFIASQTTSEK